MKFKNIITVLARPENPDNIGAVARAIKNMGFFELRLVCPPRNWRRDARKMAMSAGDVLSAAKVYSGTEKAVEDIGYLIGTTRRAGAHRGAFLDFNDAISRLGQYSLRGRAGIIFGCESKGLSNEDSSFCDSLMTIPTGNAYPSLNLAQAVIVSLFAVSCSKNNGGKSDFRVEKTLTQKETKGVIDCFKKALQVLGYREGGADLLPRILKTTRGLIKRNGLLEQEAQMIKGLSRRICEKVLSKP